MVKAYLGAGKAKAKPIEKCSENEIGDFLAALGTLGG
jgi:hypothetical protein